MKVLSGCLALDLSPSVQWAFGRSIMSHAETGLWVLPHFGSGEAFNVLEKMFTESISQHRPSFVAIGCLLIKEPFKNQFIMGLTSIVQLVCFKSNLPVKKVDKASISNSSLAYLPLKGVCVLLDYAQITWPELTKKASK